MHGDFAPCSARTLSFDRCGIIFCCMKNESSPIFYCRNPAAEVLYEEMNDMNKDHNCNMKHDQTNDDKLSTHFIIKHGFERGRSQLGQTISFACSSSSCSTPGELTSMQMCPSELSAYPRPVLACAVPSYVSFPFQTPECGTKRKHTEERVVASNG